MLEEINDWLKRNRTLTYNKELLTIKKIEDLKEWIMHDSLNCFINIEKELFKRKLINESYEWQGYKTLLAEFVCILINLEVFKPIINGKRIKDFLYTLMR